MYYYFKSSGYLKENHGKKKTTLWNSSVLTSVLTSVSFRKAFQIAIDVCVQLLQNRERVPKSGLAARFGCVVDGNIERKFGSEIEAYLPATLSQMTTSLLSEFSLPSTSLVSCNKCTASHSCPCFFPSSASFNHPAPPPFLVLPVQASLD